MKAKKVRNHPVFDRNCRVECSGPTESVFRFRGISYQEEINASNERFLKSFLIMGIKPGNEGKKDPDLCVILPIPEGMRTQYVLMSEELMSYVFFKGENPAQSYELRLIRNKKREITLIKLKCDLKAFSRN